MPITTRYNLHKVRITWQPIFPKHKLYELDLKIKEIDKCWPINRDATTKPAATKTDTTVPTQSSQKANTTQLPQQQSSQEKVKVVDKPQQKEPEKKSVRKEPEEKKKEERPQKKASKESPVSKPRDAGQKPAEIPQQVPVNKPKDAVQKADLPSKTKPEPRKVVVKTEPLPEETVKQPSPSKSVSDTSKQSLERSQSPKNDKKKLKKRKEERDHKDKRQKSPEDRKKRRLDEPHIKPTAALGAHAFLPPPALSMNPNMSIAPPRISPPIKMETDDSWRRPNGPPPLSLLPYPPMNMSSVITNETPRIGNAGNNRIFVEGRAYEVSYFYIKSL